MIEKREYSKLVAGDKVLLQNHNKSMGAVIFKAKYGDIIVWDVDGKDVYESITHLKEKKTKLLGIVKD